MAPKPIAGPYGRSEKLKDSEDRTSKDSDQPKKLIPVAPSYALAKSIIRPQLDSFGAPFYTNFSVNKFLGAPNMLESKLHPGSHNARSQSKKCITKINISLASGCVIVSLTLRRRSRALQPHGLRSEHGRQ